MAARTLLIPRRGGDSTASLPSLSGFGCKSASAQQNVMLTGGASASPAMNAVGLPKLDPTTRMPLRRVRVGSVAQLPKQQSQLAYADEPHPAQPQVSLAGHQGFPIVLARMKSLISPLCSTLLSGLYPYRVMHLLQRQNALNYRMRPQDAAIHPRCVLQRPHEPRGLGVSLPDGADLAC